MQTLILSAVSDVKRKLTLQMVLDTYWKEIFSFIFLVTAVLSYIIHAKKRANERLNLEIVKVKEQEEKIRQLSFHDSLTGLYNRTYLEEELLRLDVERQLPISIIVADVNGLKVTNDALGHSEGDILLQRAAEVLKSACIAEYILYHHEYWDGKGYPQGLKGKEIPLLSRILSIADAFDAMTNDRPYQKAISKEEAIEELKRGSGKQFDPELVPLFISIL